LRFRIIGCALAAALAVIPLVAQHADDTVRNPFTSDNDVDAGGRLYRSHCAVCHGLEGEGGRGVALTTGRFRHGSSDRGLYNTISVGIPGTEMPGIFFNGREMWQLVAFVRSLSEGKAAEQATGDPEKGSAVYAANGCSGCHRIRGAGGRLGPDLTDIGIRSMGHLQASVLNPYESVLPPHWMVRAKSSDGKPIRGLRLNDAPFSVQLIDASGSLLSLHKEDLAEFEVDRTSAMPSFEGKIQGDDLDNLIAYLASLRLGDPNDASQ